MGIFPCHTPTDGCKGVRTVTEIGLARRIIFGQAGKSNGQDFSG
jgi:hypothetical protein